MKTFAVILFFVVTLASCPENGPRPVVVSPSDSTPNTGDQVTISVDFDKSASANTAVAVACNAGSAVQIPQQVVLVSGHSELEFAVQVSSSAAPQTVHIAVSTVDGMKAASFAIQ